MEPPLSFLGDSVDESGEESFPASDPSSTWAGGNASPEAAPGSVGHSRLAAGPARRRASMPAAVIFDLDGVLIDSEECWDDARRAVATEHGGSWTPYATRAMMGMSAPEWSRYLRDQLSVDLDPGAINQAVVGRMAAIYRARLPLLPGAVDTVRSLAARWVLALASSANRELIALALDQAGLVGAFSAFVSAEEVTRGKPAPDVYLEAADRLAVAADECVAVEDSTNGLRSAAAAGMRVVAVPNSAFPPAPDALALASASVNGVADLTSAVIERAAAAAPPAA